MNYNKLGQVQIIINILIKVNDIKYGTWLKSGIVLISRPMHTVWESKESRPKLQYSKWVCNTVQL